MLVPCFKRSNPAVRGLADPETVDQAVWCLGTPPEPAPVDAGDAQTGSDDAQVDLPDASSVGHPRVTNDIDVYTRRGRKGR